MTCGTVHTSSPRSWTADMWSWAKRKWNSRVRDHRHDRQRLHFPHRIAGRANVAAQPGTTKRCLAEEPKNVCISGRGIASHCGGAVQFVWKKDAGAATDR